MIQKDSLPLDESKSVVYNICLESVNTVNSFVDKNGHNHFESMVRHILSYFENEIIGKDEATQIYVNDKKLVSKGAIERNKFRKEMKKRLRITLSEFKGLKVIPSPSKQ